MFKCYSYRLHIGGGWQPIHDSTYVQGKPDKKKGTVIKSYNHVV